MTLLTVNHLNITLAGREPRALVKDVSLAIQPGETLALVGESGSGKSLTALAIMRLLGKQFNLSGEILFDKLCILKRSEPGGEPALSNASCMGQEASTEAMERLRGNDISMIFQEPMTALNPLHTIGKQIDESLSCGAQGASTGSLALGKDPVQPPTASHRIRTLLDQVGLSHFKDRLDAFPHQLSGGERQRVMIAMAIANTPKLLIADEPTTAVDVHVQQTILDLLNQLKRDLKMSMLFITHDLPLVKRMADKVAVMKQGEIVEQGKVADVFSNPKHAYTKALLESAPKGRAISCPQDAATLMTAENLTVKFPIKRGVFARVVGYNTAVEEVSFEIKKGETIGIVGESGSGKTTLAFALLRMQRFEGKAVYMGKALDTLNRSDLLKLRKNMQMVFQDPFSSLNPRMTVGQIIGEGLKVHEPQTTNHESRIRVILEKVGLAADMAERYPHEFSGGQRQRISIARALVLEPKLVILDEPTSALDLTVQSQIIDLLKKFQQEQGLSYIFISHDLRVIRAISHRVLVLKSGRIVESADTETLFSRPQHEYSQRLIEAAMA